MAKINTTFSFKDEVSSGLKKVRGEVEQTTSGLGNMALKLMGVGSAMQIMGTVVNKFREITASINQCVQAYQYQVEQETKLSTIMKQRMNATDSAIESIKNYARAQQQLGIYGDEVIMQGAQELASFTSNTQAIKILIPAMNNLIAQQYGYSASGMDFQHTADMMGKVLSGQVGALSRLGYIFSEEEKQMLKTGDEMQRASTLAKIITDNVGNMNEALRMTDTGQMQALSNQVGDLREELGKALVPFQNMFNIATSNWKISFYKTLINVLNFVNNHPFVKALLKGLVASAIVLIGSAIAKSLIPMITKLIAKLSEMQLFAGPIGWISLAIGGLVAGVSALNSAFDDEQQKIADVSTTIDSSIESVDRFTRTYMRLTDEINSNRQEFTRWVEDVSAISTPVDEIDKILNGKGKAYSPKEYLEAYKYQMSSMATEVDRILNLKGIKFDWRNASAEEIEKISNKLYEQQGVFISYKQQYDDYLKKFNDMSRIIMSQNEYLKKQEEIANKIAESRNQALAIEEQIANAYKKTAQGKLEEQQAELQKYKNWYQQGFYTVLKQNEFSGAMYEDYVYFSKTQMSNMKVIIDEMEKSLKNDGSGALLVSDKNLVDIADDYRELLSKKATERFNLQYKSITPSVNIDHMDVHKEADADKTIALFTNRLIESASGNLTNGVA